MENIGRFGCLLLFVGVAKAAVFSPDVERTLVSYVEATMECRNVPGLTLAVVKGDGETWLRGFGTANIDNGKPVTPTTLFNIGSITKSFTMTLLAKLLYKHGYNWEAKVTDVLGEDFKFVDDVRTNETMLRDIMSHRTGLAAMGIVEVTGYPQNVTRDKLCSRLRYLPAKIPFRDAFIYNNYMFLLAGHMSEVLEGASWEDLLKAEILEPLGMTSTRIMKTPPDVLEDDVARPYLLQGDTFLNSTQDIYTISPLEPAGAILSSAEDMAKWVRFNLKKGMTADGEQVVDRWLLQEAMTAHINTANGLAICKPDFPVDHTQIGFGYGWKVSSYRGYRLISHSGSLGTYTSLLWMFPDMDIGIFASSNGPGSSFNAYLALMAVFNYASDHLLGEAPWLNETTSCSFPKPWRTWDINYSHPDVPYPPVVQYSSFDEYEGTYGSTLLPDVQISSNETDLIVTWNIVKGVLRSTPEMDTFLLELTHPMEYLTSRTMRINFTRHSGQVVGFDIGLDVTIHYEKGASLMD